MMLLASLILVSCLVSVGESKCSRSLSVDTLKNVKNIIRTSKMSKGCYSCSDRDCSVVTVGTGEDIVDDSGVTLDSGFRENFPALTTTYKAKNVNDDNDDEILIKSDSSEVSEDNYVKYVDIMRLISRNSVVSTLALVAPVAVIAILGIYLITSYAFGFYATEKVDEHIESADLLQILIRNAFGTEPEFLSHQLNNHMPANSFKDSITTMIRNGIETVLPYLPSYLRPDSYNLASLVYNTVRRNALDAISHQHQQAALLNNYETYNYDYDHLQHQPAPFIDSGYNQHVQSQLAQTTYKENADKPKRRQDNIIEKTDLYNKPVYVNAEINSKDAKAVPINTLNYKITLTQDPPTTTTLKPTTTTTQTAPFRAQDKLNEFLQMKDLIEFIESDEALIDKKEKPVDDILDVIDMLGYKDSLGLYQKRDTRNKQH